VLRQPGLLLFKMRLNRYLALCGLGSRRACEALILEGRVTVNGRRVQELATSIEAGDRVTADGREVSAAEHLTLVLYKPPKVMSTKSDPQGRLTLYDLLPPHYRHLHYVGRLDNDSEGLIVMTNDGALTQKLTHPSHKVDKEYIVTTDRPFRKEMIEKILKGIPLEEGLARAVAVHPISPRRLIVVLQQGLNRQIRRMFEALGFEVERLIRSRIGSLTIEHLKPGKWRVLRPDEVKRLGQEAGGVKAAAKRVPRIRPPGASAAPDAPAEPEADE
jgi:23S rRNA pseudouridine2605 synthase